MLFFEFFKDKFDKKKRAFCHSEVNSDSIPDALMKKLTKNYIFASKLDNNCTLLTTFDEYLQSYIKHTPIKWQWDCHQQTSFDGDFNDFIATFTKDCTLSNGIVDCHKLVQEQTYDARVINYLSTSGTLLTPPLNNELSPDFYNYS
jgi:hypothetical protein